MLNFLVPAPTNVIILLNNWLHYIESLLVDQDNNIATLKPLDNVSTLTTLELKLLKCKQQQKKILMVLSESRCFQ